MSGKTSSHILPIFTLLRAQWQKTLPFCHLMLTTGMGYSYPTPACVSIFLQEQFLEFVSLFLWDFFFNLFASFPSEGGSRGWPLSPSNSQKRSVCSSTVYPQEESYFAICMAWTLCFNPKSNIRCMRLFFFLISLAVWPAAQSLISACQSDPNCYLKFFWLISPHRLKQNNSATVFTLFLLPSWCLLSVFSNIPCLLSRSQQYISDGN